MHVCVRVFVCTRVCVCVCVCVCVRGVCVCVVDRQIIFVIQICKTKYYLERSGAGFPERFHCIYCSLFTLRNPHSPLILNGEEGFLRVNRLHKYIRNSTPWSLTDYIAKCWHSFSFLCICSMVPFFHHVGQHMTDLGCISCFILSRHSFYLETCSPACCHGSWLFW